MCDMLIKIVFKKNVAPYLSIITFTWFLYVIQLDNCEGHTLRNNLIPIITFYLNLLKTYYILKIATLWQTFSVLIYLFIYFVASIILAQDISYKLAIMHLNFNIQIFSVMQFWCFSFQWSKWAQLPTYGDWSI